jgi:hypothetical protein
LSPQELLETLVDLLRDIKATISMNCSEKPGPVRLGRGTPKINLFKIDGDSQPRGIDEGTLEE